MKQPIVITLSFLLLFSLNAFGQDKKVEVGDKARGKASYYNKKFNGRKTASGEVYYARNMTCAHLKLPFGAKLKVTNLRNRKSVIVKVNDRGPFSKDRIVDLSFRAASLLDMLKEGVASVEIEVVELPKTEMAVNDVDEADFKAAVDKKTDTKKTDTKKVETKTDKATVTKKADTSAKTVASFSAGKTYNVWGTEQKPSGYGIQIASYKDKSEAIDIAKEATGLGLKPLFIQCGWANNEKVYRLIFGNYATAAAAKDDMIKVKMKGFKSGFVKKHF